MKIFSRVLAVLAVLLVGKLHAGNLKVSITPAQAVSAGAQWRVDSGTWRNSDTTVNNLTNTNHTVDFKNVAGWIAPAALVATVTSGQTTTLTASYVQLAQLTVTLSPASGRWRIDGGSWRNSGATASNLALGNHSLEYIDVTGYVNPGAETVTLTAGQSLSLSRSYVQLAKLKVTLSPTSGQWRVDGGSWNTSGATVSNLPAGAHTVDYTNLSGYVSPASESVTLSSGQTFTINRSYAKVAQVKVTLTPSSGQWQIDGGAWLSSGATATNLAPGAHTVAYAAIAQYASPATETISLTAGQVLSFARSYVALAKITVSLVPSNGQWRVNGGSWQASGGTAWVLPGSALVEYASLPLYDSPPSENLTLAAGAVFAATRNYVSQKPTLRINLSPTNGQWRVDGGSWNASGAIVTELSIGSHSVDYSDVGGTYAPLASETVALGLRENAVLSRTYPTKPPASLSVILTPNSAQWRVDGGAWQPSGATVGNLAYATSHTIDYSSVAGYVTPAGETLTLTSGQSLGLTRNYVQLAEIILNLVPNSGQWRANGGAWQASGASLFVPAGDYSIDYSSLDLHDSPAAETITLTAGGLFTATRNYVSQRPTLRINLSPTNGQWRVDGGDWQASGNQVTELDVGPHVVDYTDLAGDYDPIASETVSLALRQNAVLTRNYPIKPASVVVTLNPAQAQWRIYAPQATPPETWQASGATIGGLRPGTYVIEYAPLDGYVEPDLETVELTPGQLLEISHDYSTLSGVRVVANPSWLQTQWRIDGGAWQAMGASATHLTFGVPHTIDFSSDPRFGTPPPQTVTLASGENRTITATYLPYGSLTLNVGPNGIAYQWRIDGGPWLTSNVADYVSFGVPHTIEFSPVDGYITPGSPIIVLASGENKTISTNYFALPGSIFVDASPKGVPAQWRIDGGVWQNFGTSLTGISSGGVVHNIEFSSAPGYITPVAQSFTLNAGEARTITATYTALATMTANSSPNQIGAQWRIDGGAWIDMGNYASNLAFGIPHTVEFAPVPGYVTPPPQTITLLSGEYRTITATYAKLATLLISTNPYSLSSQFRVDGGPWTYSYISVSNLSFGVPHLIEFSDVSGYVTPPSQTVTLLSGEYRTITATYAKLASIYVSISPNSISSQYRVDGGPWTYTYVSTSNLSFGVPHLVEFSDVSGYVAPPSQTVTLLSGELRTVSATYQKLASIYVSINPNSISSQYRVDGGPWTYSYQSTSNLSFGVPHLVEFSDVSGYVTPPAQTVTLLSGELRTVAATYPKLASIYVSINPNGLSSQYRVDSGPWTYSYQSTSNLSLDVPHSVEFSDVSGYITPPAQSVTLLSGEFRTVSATYTPLASLYVTLMPSSGQWRVDGGAWIPSGTNVSALSIGSHTIDYSDLAGYITPPSETVNVVSGYNPSISRSYTIAHPASVSITLTPAAGSWQISPVGSTSGVWNASGATVNNLLPGNYSISYSVINGYDEPPAELITLTDDDNRILSRSYTPSAFATIATPRDSGGSNPSGTPSGTSTISCILGTDGYLYYAAYAEPGVGYGHLFRMRQDGTDYKELKRFGTDPADGFEPRALFESSDGMLYGCTKNSIFNSPVNQGTVFRLNKDGSGYTVLYTFVFSSNGVNPTSLIEGSDGVLYGTTENGGAALYGAVFKLNKDGSGYTVLGSLSLTNGINPQNIVEGPGGLLYGCARYRGSNGNGTLFKLNKNGTGFAVFKNFTGGLDGSTPIGGLLAGRDGVIYGTVSSGGNTNKGLVFRVNPDGTGYQVLHSFTGAGSDGADPETPLTEDAAGTLYGVTLTGGTYDYGTLFKLNKNGTAYTRILNLTAGTNDGGWPRQRVVVAPGGMIFGSGSIGGTLNNGVLFTVAPDGTAFSNLHQNGTQDGVAPTYRVLAASDGSVYGTTAFGGAHRVGTLYRTTGDGTNYTVLHSFADAADSGLPLGQVLEASDGFLYGTTYGLQSADGTLYRIAKDGSAYSVIHRFDGTTNGKAAWGGVIEGSDGVLYGTCTSGGTTNLGAVYRVNKDGSGFALIHSFLGGTVDGALPKAELLLGNDGRLYGTSSSGGSANLGTVFVLNTDGSGYNVLRHFTGGTADAANPVSPLRQGSNGLLYGTTPWNAQNAGTVYQLASNGSNYAVLKVFPWGTLVGYDPASSGLVEKGGKLYGTTARGGSFDKGTIYSINLDGSGYQIWINFGATSADGMNPSIGLSLAPNGMMYGTTYFGGRIASSWTIFRFVQ